MELKKLRKFLCITNTAPYSGSCKTDIFLPGCKFQFQQVLPACKAFDKFTACSTTVIQQYRKNGFEFLRRAFNDPSSLEDLTGLTQMHQETLDAEVWGFSDNEECSSKELS